MHILQERGFKEINRRCADCNTARTPLWRGGPAGPRSLCNACGIRYRKIKRALLGLSRDCAIEKSKSIRGIDVHCTVGKGKWKSKLREEEQTAFLLMSLSCGYV